MLEAASHQGCSPWIGQHLGGSNQPALFTKEDLDNLPKLSDADQGIASILPGDMQKENMDDAEWEE